MKSISFYDQNAKAYIEQTCLLDMTLCYQKFEKHISHGHILDLGCGSGRDSQYFLSKGFNVTAVDGSLEMVRHCQKSLEAKVIHSLIETYETEDRYEGIWASASLIHIKREAMVHVVQKYIGYLKTGGIFYMSFKSYPEDFNYQGRYFTCYTITSVYEVLDTLKYVDILEVSSTESVQKDNMTWLNIVLRKK